MKVRRADNRTTVLVKILSNYLAHTELLNKTSEKSVGFLVACPEMYDSLYQRQSLKCESTDAVQRPCRKFRIRSSPLRAELPWSVSSFCSEYTDGSSGQELKRLILVTN